MTYYKRIIDKKLLEWKASQRRKPLLIRGARQVGTGGPVEDFLSGGWYACRSYRMDRD